MDDVKTSQKERERIYCHDNVLHAYSWRAQEANQTSKVLTIWYACDSCDYCLIKTYGPDNKKCSLVHGGEFTFKTRDNVVR